jgi:hypothetical protein
MRKIKITADAVLAIVQSIFADDDINAVVDDPSAPPSWAGKTVAEILNVEYYTFKHRPISTQTVINKMLEERGEANQLAAVNRAFCLCSLGDTERLFSKDVDMAVLSASLEYYIQSNKIKLLEYLIEDCNIATSGLRVPVQFGDEMRKAVIIFGRPNVEDIQTAAAFGEMALAEVEVSILLYPDAVSYSDYEVSLGYTDSEGNIITANIPLASLAAVSTGVQKAMPSIGKPQDTGNINLSKARSFVLVFDGYTNVVVEHIVDKTLRGDESAETDDNNEPFILTIKRGEKTYVHTVIVKDHQLTVNSDTNNETQTLTLVKGGI